MLSRFLISIDFSCPRRRSSIIRQAELSSLRKISNDEISELDFHSFFEHLRFAAVAQKLVKNCTLKSLPFLCAAILLFLLARYIGSIVFGKETRENCTEKANEKKTVKEEDTTHPHWVSFLLKAAQHWAEWADGLMGWKATTRANISNFMLTCLRCWKMSEKREKESTLTIEPSRWMMLHTIMTAALSSRMSYARAFHNFGKPQIFFRCCWAAGYGSRSSWNWIYFISSSSSMMMVRGGRLFALFILGSAARVHWRIMKLCRRSLIVI